MTDLSITASAVALVRTAPDQQFTGPAAETIVAGQYVRFNTTNGKVELGKATTAAEARSGGIALNGGIAGQAITFVGEGAILDLGDALDALTYDDDVYLSDTDGTLADASGTITKLVGRVVPGWGYTTADKLFQVRMTEAIDVSFDLAKSNLPTGFAKAERVAGQDETGDTTIPVAGLAAGDELVALFVEDGASGKWTQRANADFTVGAANLTVVANAANNAANAYIVFWIDRTP